jgi:hypothetical protein
MSLAVPTLASAQTWSPVVVQVPATQPAYYPAAPAPVAEGEGCDRGDEMREGFRRHQGVVAHLARPFMRLLAAPFELFGR